MEVEVRGFRRGVEVDGVCGGVCGVRGGNMAVVSRAEDRENGSEAGEGAAGAAGGFGRAIGNKVGLHCLLCCFAFHISFDLVSCVSIYDSITLFLLIKGVLRCGSFS